MLAVAAEQLVGALSRKRHRHVLGRELGERDEAERGEIRERLVEMPDETVERDRLLRERELELVVLGAEHVGDETRIGELVAVACLLEADRERLHRAIHQLRHQRHDQARVEPSAQHRTERDVAHQSQANRLLEPGQQPHAPLLEVAAALERRLRVAPVPAFLDLAVLDDEDAARLELSHCGERRRRRREEAERQVGVDRLVVEVGRDEPAREEALELGREDEEVTADRVVDRLDPEPVSCDHATLACLVPDRDPEHSRVAAPGTRPRAPRRGAAGSRCRSGSRSGAHGAAGPHGS